MKRIIASLMASALLAPALLFAQPQNVSGSSDKNIFPTVHWVSKNSSDAVTIQNSNGVSLLIVINVDGVGSTGVPGVNIANCGNTTHINAGSSAICETNDANHPVTLNSDNSTIAATGNYQIKQK